MKRFLIFLLTIVFVLLLFFLLATRFKAQGLYIALLALSIVFLLSYAFMLIVALLTRSLGKKIQNCEYDKVIKYATILNKLTFSLDEHIELNLYKSLAYSLLNDFNNSQEVLYKVIKKNVRNARLLNLYYYAERLLYICSRDKDKYRISMEEFFSLANDPNVILKNEIYLGYEIINLSQGIINRVKIEDIKDNINLEDNNQPLLVHEFYTLFSLLIKMNEELVYEEKYLISPLCISLVDDLKTKMQDRLSYSK